MFSALLIAACAAQTPIAPAPRLATYPTDLSRFGGAIDLIRDQSPLPELKRHQLAMEKLAWSPAYQTPEGATAIRDAYFVWDVWDDLAIAMRQFDQGQFERAGDTLHRLRLKIGERAFAAGEMPAVLRETFIRDNDGAKPE